MPVRTPATPVRTPARAPRARRRAAVVAGLAASLALAACSGAADEPDVPAGTTAEPTSAAPAPVRTARKVRTRVLPQIAANGADPQAADDAAWVVEVRDPAARAGQTYELEVADGDSWKVVGTAEAGRGGRASLTTSTPGEHRVVTDREAGRAGAPVDTASAPALDLSDEFDTLDPALWQTRAQGYAGIRTCSRADDAAARARGGVLRLSVLDDPAMGECTAEGGRHAYRLNGHIGTEGRYAFTHGFAAARIKFQPRKGQHGAFWLQTPWIGFGDPATNGAEIDVVEWFGEGMKTGGLTSFAYWHPSAEEPAKVGGWLDNHADLGSDWASEFHVFSVEWTPDEYVFRVDDKVAWRTDEGVSGVPEFLVLSLLSSDYELKHLDTADLPQHMEVDWVRTWGTGSRTGTYAAPAG